MLVFDVELISIPNRAPADVERSVALDQCRVADAYAGNVGDRVQRRRRADAYLDPVIASSHLRSSVLPQLVIVVRVPEDLAA